MWAIVLSFWNWLSYHDDGCAHFFWPSEKLHFKQQPFNTEFITCFHQFVPRFFLSLRRWKRKETFYWSKTFFFSICKLKQKSKIRLLKQNWRFVIWDWWKHLMNSLLENLMIFTVAFFALNMFIQCSGSRWLGNRSFHFLLLLSEPISIAGPFFIKSYKNIIFRSGLRIQTKVQLCLTTYQNSVLTFYVPKWFTNI